MSFLAAESEFDIRFSPSRLDLAVQEVEIFAFLQNIEKKLAKADYHYILDVFQCFFGF